MLAHDVQTSLPGNESTLPVACAALAPNGRGSSGLSNRGESAAMKYTMELIVKKRCAHVKKTRILRFLTIGFMRRVCSVKPYILPMLPGDKMFQIGTVVPRRISVQIP